MPFKVTRDGKDLRVDPQFHNVLLVALQTHPTIFATQEEAEDAVDHTIDYATEHRYAWTCGYEIVMLPPPETLLTSRGRLYGFYCCGREMEKVIDANDYTFTFGCRVCNQRAVASSLAMR